MKYALVLTGMALNASMVLGAPQTYPLKCRPGPNTAVNINVAGEIRFGFTRSAGAAGASGQNLRPGECAWVDRAVGPAEPAYVVASENANFKLGAVVPHASNNSFKGYVYSSSGAWVYNFITKDTILTVHAYNDGGQVMRIPNP